jgi:uncharacterized protein (TIGR00251 family)
LSSFDIETIRANVIRFRVRVSPGAKKPSIGGCHDGALKIAVAAPADKGKANAAVIKALAKRLDVAKSNVEITAGQTRREKTIEITSVDAETAFKKLHQ